MPFAKRCGAKLAHQKKKKKKTPHHKDKIYDNAMSDLNNMINEEQEGQKPIDLMRNNDP